MTCDLEEYLVQDTESESSPTCVCLFHCFLDFISTKHLDTFVNARLRLVGEQAGVCMCQQLGNEVERQGKANKSNLGCQCW